MLIGISHRNKKLIRNFITFEADFPEDGVWDESDHPIRPSGKLVAESLRRGLMSEGLECSDVTQHSFYGWKFDIAFEDSKLECLFQYPEPWLLITEMHTTFWQSFLDRKKENIHQSSLLKIKSVLQGDSRFRRIRFFSKKEYETKGQGSERP